MDGVSGRGWERETGHTDWSLKANKKRAKFHWIIQHNTIKHWIVCVCVCVSFTQHWASKQLKSNSIKCHTHTHTWTFLVHCERHWVACFLVGVCYNGISEHIYRRNIQSTGNDLKDSERRDLWTSASYSLDRPFFLRSTRTRFQSSPTIILHSDVSLYPTWYTESHNKQEPSQHVSHTHRLVCALCVRVYMVDRSKFMEQLFWHCALWTTHIVRCRKIIAYVHHEMRLQ